MVSKRSPLGLVCPKRICWFDGVDKAVVGSGLSEKNLLVWWC